VIDIGCPSAEPVSVSPATGQIAEVRVLPVSYSSFPGRKVPGLSDFFRIPIRQKPHPAQVRDLSQCDIHFTLSSFSLSPGPQRSRMCSSPYARMRVIIPPKSMYLGLPRCNVPCTGYRSTCFPVLSSFVPRRAGCEFPGTVNTTRNLCEYEERELYCFIKPSSTSSTSVRMSEGNVHQPPSQVYSRETRVPPESRGDKHSTFANLYLYVYAEW